MNHNEIIDHELVQTEYWDKIAELSYSTENLSYPALLEMERFFDFVGLKEDKSILEIGCGTGKFTLPLLRKGYRILAIDISEKSLDVLARKAREEGLGHRLIVEKSNFELEQNVQRHFGQFDIVLCVASIHHFDPTKKERIFANIVKTLKRGGKLIALEPNPLNPLYYFLYLWREIINVQNRNRWATEMAFLKLGLSNLKRLFENNGLGQIQVKRYAWLPSKFAIYCPFVIQLNEFLLKVPLIRNMSAFIWIKGRKT